MWLKEEVVWGRGPRREGVAGILQRIRRSISQTRSLEKGTTGTYLPYCAARSRAVSWRVLRMVGSHECSSSWLTTAVCPYWDAQCSAVSRSLVWNNNNRGSVSHQKVPGLSQRRHVNWLQSGLVSSSHRRDKTGLLSMCGKKRWKLYRKRINHLCDKKYSHFGISIKNSRNCY